MTYDNNHFTFAQNMRLGTKKMNSWIYPVLEFYQVDDIKRQWEKFIRIFMDIMSHDI